MIDREAGSDDLMHDEAWAARLPRFTLDATVIGAGVIGLLVMWFGGTPRGLGFPLDDAWIHMVYGRSLAEDGLLAFNTGAPASEPCWPGRPSRGLKCEKQRRRGEPLSRIHPRAWLRALDPRGQPLSSLVRGLWLASRDRLRHLR